MSYEVNHSTKQVIATSEEQSVEENLQIAQYVGTANYEFVEYVKPKKKRKCKNKAYYLKRLREEDKAEFERLCKQPLGSGGWQQAKKFAESKLAEYKQEETNPKPEE